MGNLTPQSNKTSNYRELESNWRHTAFPSISPSNSHTHTHSLALSLSHTHILVPIGTHTLTLTHMHSQQAENHTLLHIWNNLTHALTCTHPSFHTHTLTQALWNRGLKTQLAIIIGCNLRPKFINLHKAISGKGIIRAIIRNRVER